MISKEASAETLSGDMRFFLSLSLILPPSFEVEIAPAEALVIVVDMDFQDYNNMSQSMYIFDFILFFRL
jgi:hypothetical protein